LASWSVSLWRKLPVSPFAMESLMAFSMEKPSVLRWASLKL
jgi:hypothetical protein